MSCSHKMVIILIIYLPRRFHTLPDIHTLTQTHTHRRCLLCRAVTVRTLSLRSPTLRLNFMSTLILLLCHAHVVAAYDSLSHFLPFCQTFRAAALTICFEFQKYIRCVWLPNFFFPKTGPIFPFITISTRFVFSGMHNIHSSIQAGSYLIYSIPRSFLLLPSLS